MINLQAYFIFSHDKFAGLLCKQLDLTALKNVLDGQPQTQGQTSDANERNLT